MWSFFNFHDCEFTRKIYFQVERSNLSAINEDELNDTFNITRKPPDFGERAGSELESNDSFANSLNSAKDAVLHGASL